MKKLLIAALLCVTASVSAQKTIFTGTYKINESKSEYAGKPTFVLPSIIKLLQHPDRILISRTAFDEKSKALPVELDTVIFSSVKKRFVPGTNHVVVNSFKWVNDRSFIKIRESIDQHGKVAGSVTETWSLDGTGNTLILKRDIVSTGSGAKHASYSTKGVYVRQENQTNVKSSLHKKK